MNSDSIHPPDDPNDSPGVDGTEDVSMDDGADEGADQEQSEAAAVNNVVSLLPVHAAPYTQNRPRSEGGGDALKVQRSRGRPRKIERMPTTSDLEYHAQMAAERGSFIDQDQVVKSIRAGNDPLAVLKYVKEQVAVEQAALHFQRIENEKHGRDTAQVSSRRIDALKKIADIELELKKLGGDVVDVNGEHMQRIFKFFIEKVREVLEANLQPEELDLVFNRLSTEFEGWQEKLSEVLR